MRSCASRVGALELVDELLDRRPWTMLPPVDSLAAAPRLWQTSGAAPEPGRVERASSVISGTPASAFETGQFVLRALGGLAEAGLVDPGHAPAHGRARSS